MRAFPIAVALLLCSGPNVLAECGVLESEGGLRRPVEGRFAVGFGMRWHPILGVNRMHEGIDVVAPMGTAVVAAAPGTVTHAGKAGDFGNAVRISHGRGMETLYGHLSRIFVREGDCVALGNPVGQVGTSDLKHRAAPLFRGAAGRSENRPGAVCRSRPRAAGPRDRAHAQRATLS